MKFNSKDIKYITQVLYNLYSLAKKKKLKNIPVSFEEFIIHNIDDKLCPPKCLEYASDYK